MADLSDFLNIIERVSILSWIPNWVKLILVVLLLVWTISFALSKIKDIWVEKFIPLFYDRDERRRSRQRGLFAENIENQIGSLNANERWSDYQFTELEAEVESEGKQRAFSLIPFVGRTRRGLQHEYSLSKALQTSAERLILLEGEAGAGKSVALRHVALRLAQSTKKHPKTNSIIPLYINLKELRRDQGETIDVSFIHSFVKRYLNKMNDRNIEVFIDEEFDRGIREGTWLFLFDSFDEIPEVLAATEADVTTRIYAEAISAFLQGLNKCRGIIASRQFRGPDLLNWPHFRIKELSEKQRNNFIKKADLPRESEIIIARGLASSEEDIRLMTRNPMFLGLLCDQVKLKGLFPQNAQAMLENHINNRFSRDEARIFKRFGITIDKVRSAAENFAFCMAMDPTLGLSPTRSQLRQSLFQSTIKIHGDIDLFCDVLEYIKLAHSETIEGIPVNSKHFTFAHRRFQEYFATCVVLREQNKATPKQLLTDYRWRETTVTLFQTQPIDALEPILRELRILLKEYVNETAHQIGDPIEYINVGKKPGQAVHEYESFLWPPASLHILDLLQQGFTRRTNEIPNDIRKDVARLVLTATVTGTLIDRKYALEVAGSVPSPVLFWLLNKAFTSKSRWLRDVAYRQVSKLDVVSDVVAGWIRNRLVSSSLEGFLGRERLETEAFLTRLPNATDLLAIERLLLWVPWISAIFNIAVIFTITAFLVPQAHQTLAVFSLSTLFVLSIIIRWRYPFSPGLQRLPLFPSFLMLCVLLLVLSSTLLGITSLIILSYAYFLFWPAFAFLLAKEGKFYQVFWWPFYPIIYIFIWILHAPSRFFDFIRMFKAREFLIMALITLGFATLMYAIFRYSKKNDTIVVLFFFGFATVGVCYALWLMGLDLFYWLHDCNIWYRWTKKQTGAINLNELVKLLNKYKSPSFYIRTIRFVREKGILTLDEYTIEQLKRLIIVVEQVQLKGPTFLFNQPTANYTDNEISDYKFLRNWLVGHKNNDPSSLNELGPVFLDEICQLTEETQKIIDNRRIPIKQQ
jgi:NACHT domain